MSYLETYTNSLNNPSLAESIKKTAKEVMANVESQFDFSGQLTGLLLGNVQSGKTGQMLGVISDLADKGYRVFILLTTDNVDLQRQTYNRVKDALTTFTVLSSRHSKSVDSPGSITMISPALYSIPFILTLPEIIQVYSVAIL